MARQSARAPRAVKAAASVDSAEPVYHLSDVSKVFGSGNTLVRALDGVDLEVVPGEFVAIIGASGSGKTTLLQLLGALDRPTSGQIAIQGRDLATLGEKELTRLRREEIGFVFQSFNLIPTLTAAANVEAAIASGQLGSHARSERVAELLDTVGLAGRAHHLPSQLSGGEQQRVAIARALANRPAVLLADEPTGNLDTVSGNEILELLKQLVAQGNQTVVLITHEVTIAKAAQRTISLQDGRILTDSRSRLGARAPRASARKPAS